MRQHRRDMKDRNEFVRREDLRQQLPVTKIAPNALQVVVSVGIRDQVDIDAAKTLGQQSPLQNPTEETRASGDQDFKHPWSLNFRDDRRNRSCLSDGV